MDKFRFIFQPCFEQQGDPFKSEIVGSYDLAKKMLNSIADYTLHLHELSLMPDYSNYGHIEQRVNGEWIEIDFD